MTPFREENPLQSPFAENSFVEISNPGMTLAHNNRPIETSAFSGPGVLNLRKTPSKLVTGPLCAIESQNRNSDTYLFSLPAKICPVSLASILGYLMVLIRGLKAHPEQHLEGSRDIPVLR